MITSRPTLCPDFSHGVKESQLLQYPSVRCPVGLLKKDLLSWTRGRPTLPSACTVPPFSSRAFSGTPSRSQKATYHTSVVWIGRVEALSTLPLQIPKASPLPVFNPPSLPTTNTRPLESSLYWAIHAERGCSNCTKLDVLKAFNCHNNR